MDYKTMTVKRLIEELQKIAAEHGGDLPVHLLKGPMADDALAICEATQGLGWRRPKLVLLD